MSQMIIVTGYVGREPEMRYAPSGDAVTNFSIASTRKYKRQDGEKVEETTWFRVTVWGKRAETVTEWVHKGALLQVVGELISDPETGGPKIFKRNTGYAGANFEIKASNVEFLKLKDAEDEEGEGSGNGGGVPVEPSGQGESSDAGDEPF